VRVGDFGIAREVATQADPVSDAPVADDAVTQERGILATPLTKTGSVVGTFGYVAPEVMLGQPIDARADQFSFAVSLYEALYGARPFPGRTYRDYYASLMEGPPDAPPREAAAPAWLFKVVHKGLSVRPEERYGAMTEMLEALEPPKGLLGLFKR
jgi:serine/threonine protein kinase